MFNPVYTYYVIGAVHLWREARPQNTRLLLVHMRTPQLDEQEQQFGSCGELVVGRFQRLRYSQVSVRYR